MVFRLTLENAPASVSRSGLDFGNRASLIIGRSEHADWCLPDPRRLLSACHCQIALTDQGFELSDLSTNGTFLNDAQARLETASLLKDGDRFRIGEYLIRVDMAQQESAPAADAAPAAGEAGQNEPRLELTIINERRHFRNHEFGASLGRDGKLTIGRDSSADWTLPDPTGGISREHCEVYYQDGLFLIQDKSSNGTFVNGSGDKVKGAYPLKDGDQLSIGAFVIGVKVTNLAPAERVASAPPRQLTPVKVAPLKRGGDPAALAATDAAELQAKLAAIPSPGAETDSGYTRILPQKKPEPPQAAPAKPAAPEPSAPARKAPELGEVPPTAGLMPGRIEEDLSGGEPVWDGARTIAPLPPRGTADPAPVIAALARGLGLHPGDLAQADPLAAAEQAGRLLHLLTDALRLWSQQNTQALGEGGRSEGAACNPLTFMPTTDEALRVLFGPPRKAYLDADSAYAATVNRLSDHSAAMTEAIKRAVVLWQDSLAPEAIENAVAGDKGLGQLLTSRKARLWDTYVDRRQAIASLKRDAPVASFLQAFPEPARKKPE